MACTDHPPRWLPDDQLISAVLAGRHHPVAALTAPDRAWLVAGLTLAGLTVDDIAARLDCSRRLVQTVRAEPMTAVCLLAQTEAAHFADELRLAQTELTVARRSLDCAEAERDQARRQVAQFIPTGEVCRAGLHQMTRYNTYVTPAGRRRCRACHAARQAGYRHRNHAGTTICDTIDAFLAVTNED